MLSLFLDISCSCFSVGLIIHARLLIHEPLVDLLQSIIFSKGFKH